MEFDVQTPGKTKYLFFTNNFWVLKSDASLFKQIFVHAQCNWLHNSNEVEQRQYQR